MSTDLFVEQLMERFLHLHDAEEPSDELLLPIYLPLEAPALDEVLKFDVVVPVVLTHFEDIEQNEGLRRIVPSQAE